MASEDIIRERFPLHWNVWHENVQQLREQIVSKLCDLETLDPRGRTPLNLAATRGALHCVEVLLEAGADPTISNKEGWDALQEAVGCGDPQILSLLMQHKEFQRLTKRNGGVVDILNSLEQTDDFYLEMKWEFTSWVPFISRMCPSDTYKIYKSGANVRVDTTLLGFDQMNWQRGNQSFIFKAGVDTSYFYEIDRDKKSYWKESIKTGAKNVNMASMKPPPEMVSARMTSPNVATVLDTEKIAFSRLKAGFLGWGGDRVERLGQYECKIYSVSGVDFVTRTRTEHMSEDQCTRFKADKQAARESMPSFLHYLEEEEEEQNTEQERGNNTNSNSVNIIEYFDIKSFPKSDIGVAKKMSSKSQKFSATLGLCDDFPLSLEDQVLPIIKLMANSNSHFAKLRDFITLQLPAGFPVKIEIPLFRIMNARVTFSNLNGCSELSPGVVTFEEQMQFQPNVDDPAESKVITKCMIDKSIFDIPNDFIELGTQYNVIQDHRDAEDELLQLAIQQSLTNSGQDPQENVTVFEALGFTPNYDQSEEEGLRRAILASLETDVAIAPVQPVTISDDYMDEQLLLALEVSQQEVTATTQQQRSEEEELQRIIQLSLTEK